jgi:hypothetical protein
MPGDNKAFLREYLSRFQEASPIEGARQEEMNYPSEMQFGFDAGRFADQAAFPPVTGKMDAAERLKMYSDPTGRQYYVGPGGRELTPAEVDRIMRAGVRGA